MIWNVLQTGQYSQYQARAFVTNLGDTVVSEEDEVDVDDKEQNKAICHSA